MLPPALLAAQAGEQTPVTLALLAALEQQWLEARRRCRSGARRRLPRQRRGLGSALHRRAARSAAGCRARRDRIGDRAASPARNAVGARRLRRGRHRLAVARQRGMAVDGVVPAARHPVRRTASISLRAGEHLLVGSQLDQARRSVTPGGPHHPAAATATVFPGRSSASTACRCARCPSQGVSPFIPSGFRLRSTFVRSRWRSRAMPRMSGLRGRLRPTVRPVRPVICPCGRRGG